MAPLHRDPVRVDRRAESLQLIEPIVAELGYTGQISFDFLVTDDGLSFVECNPRATDGVLLLPDADRPRPARPGRRHLPDAARRERAARPRGWSATASPIACERLPQSIRDLARVHDAGDGWHDPLPTLYSALSVAHFAGVSPARARASSQDAMAGDMTWDGEPIRGCRTPTRRLLAELTAG